MIPSAVAYWRPVAEDVAKSVGVDASFLLALVWQESAGNPRAYRYEEGFWRRYCAGKPEWTRGHTPDALEHWARRCAASYGLAQVMYPTAIMLGMDRRAQPETLFEPHCNLHYAAKLIAKHAASATDERGVALAYNGGARAAYADELLAKLVAVRKG